MSEGNTEAKAIVERFSKMGETGDVSILEKIPKEERFYKCRGCLRVVKENPCPECGESKAIEIMCPLDHCHCKHDITSGVAYCPLCGKAICPECGSHDVSQLSRVTGYVQEVGGWNAGKQQELKDRVRYDVGSKTIS